MLAQFSKTVFAIRAEAFPVWALCLKRVFCSDLFVVDFESSKLIIQLLKSRQIDPTLWIRLEEYLGVDRMHYKSKVPADTLYLCFGSMTYLLDHCELYSDYTALVISNCHGRCRNFPSMENVVWLRVWHASFNGPTGFETVIGYVKCPTTSPQVTAVRRSVSDFINYGLESFEFRSVINELLVRDLFHPIALPQYVRYPSSRALGGHIS